MDTFLEEAQRQLEEMQREWEREQERERILAEIKEHEKVKSRALNQLDEAKDYRTSFENVSNKFSQRFISEPIIARGSVNEEYLRVHEIFLDRQTYVKNYYNNIIEDANGMISLIDKKISDLYVELANA